MEQKTITRMIRISGMKQLNCENKIENELKKIQGIRYIKVKYIDKTVLITYDKGLVEFLEIIERVESLGYIVELVGEPINSVEKNMCNEFIAKTLKISGMSCSSCEIKIENEMKNIKGIMGVNAKYTDGTVHIEFDSSKIELIQIINIIESLDYKVLLGDKRSNSKKKQSGSEKKLSIISILGIVIIILVTFLTIKNTIGFNFIPEINKNMGYGILFLVGILTSLHCIAMCGGINLSQCVSYKTNKGNGTFSKLRPSMLYNLGRIISYTLIGGIIGGLGSVISLSGTAKGFVSILAGVFMIIMSLNMLDIFLFLRKFIPRMPKIIGKKIYSNKGKYSPFYVGLLNGLMPCGPLQSMQIYALGTGSFVSGALSMFIFSLGTLPLMFGFGAITSMLSSKFTHKMMRASAALVMVLGVIMLNRGFALSGINPIGIFDSTNKIKNQNKNENMASISGDVQYVTTKITTRSYPPITVKKGIPVKWIMIAEKKDLNGCNNAIQIPEYHIGLKLKAGENLIEFTPQKAGIYSFSCWMGMIRSQIIVVD